MRIINKGASALELVDPKFPAKDGEPVPSSAKIEIGIGDDIPQGLWEALPQEKRDFLVKTGSVEVTDDKKAAPTAAAGPAKTKQPA